MPSLSDLPLELLIAIPLSRQSLARVVRANRRLYHMLNPVLYERNTKGSSPKKSCILWGALNGRLGTVKLGHQYGGDLNLDPKDTPWTDSRSSQTWAYRNRAKNMADCATALQIAVRYGHTDIVAYLLEHEADVHAPSLACCRCKTLDYLSYPLHEIVCTVPGFLRGYRNKGRDEAIATLLIQHGAYLHAPAQPVLHSLIKNDQSDLIIQLLENVGTRATAEKAMGKLPLHVAAQGNCPGVADILLNRFGADLYAVDDKGRTPAELAAKSGHLEVLRVLIKKDKASPEDTAEHLVKIFRAAVQSYRMEAPKFLLQEYGERVLDWGRFRYFPSSPRR